MLYLGTSGFSYKDWVGPVYPPRLQKRDWLSFYGHEFNTCEINSTFYAIPNQFTMEALGKKVGRDFMFAVKANQEITHTRSGDSRMVASFVDCLKPIVEAGKLGCVLLQFPFSFRFTPGNRDYLGLTREKLGEIPTVVEFRHASWFKEDVFDWLNQNDLGFCCVDEPRLQGLMPPVARATGRIGYVRFHGRNTAKWWDHDESWERYDYSYGREELIEWLPRIREIERQSQKTFVFANNHWRGQSVDTIRQLKLLLD